MAIGEFDAFFVSVQFLLFAILFGMGWLWGWGFSRVRYWSVFMAAAILSASILLIAKAQMDSVYRLLRDFTPTILYAVYIIYASEQIYNYKDKSQKFWWFMTRRLGLFGLLAILMFGGVVYLMQGEIKDTVANYGGGGKQDAKLVGPEAGATGAVEFQTVMQFFDAVLDIGFYPVFHPAPNSILTYHHIHFCAFTPGFQGGINR